MCGQLATYSDFDINYVLLLFTNYWNESCGITQAMMCKLAGQMYLVFDEG